jgi:SAM-dependent methyltransferase
MYGIAPVDAGRNIDWSLSANDYANHRPGQPLAFFSRLAALGIGVPGQRILDLGTGTGDLARQFAKQGASAAGTDIASGQIDAAKFMAARDKLNAEFFVAPAHENPFPDHTFDAITANQCWLYFDREKSHSEVRRLLKPGGLLCVSYSSWLVTSEIVKASEALVLKYNPVWGGKNWHGIIPPQLDEFKEAFVQHAMFWFDIDLPFTRESWRGRMRACRGTGATLPADQLEAFDAEHAAVLEKIAPPEFAIPHRCSAHIVSPR